MKIYAEFCSLFKALFGFSLRFINLVSFGEKVREASTLEVHLGFGSKKKKHVKTRILSLIEV